MIILIIISLQVPFSNIKLNIVYTYIVVYGCPPGLNNVSSLVVANDKHCFHFAQQDTTFHLAQINCEQFGGNLAAVIDNETHVFLYQHGLSLIDKGEFADRSHYWIGGTVQRATRRHSWITGNIYWSSFRILWKGVYTHFCTCPVSFDMMFYSVMSLLINGVKVGNLVV